MMQKKIPNDVFEMSLLLFIMPTSIITILSIYNNYLTYHAPTQYVLSSYYPLTTTNTGISINTSYTYIFYGINQSNGTACIAKAKELVYRYNYTEQKYVLIKQFFVTNRNNLIDLVNSNLVDWVMSSNNRTIRVDPGYTLVCPQVDFQN